MKQAPKIIFGLALVAAGILWILSIVGVLDCEFSTKGWWTLFIIVPCLFALFTDKNKVGPCVGICMGVLLLLAAREVITWDMMWQIGLALVVIGFGIQLLFFKHCNHNGVYKENVISRDGKDIRHIETSFGKQVLSFAGQKFEGADVESSFGSLVLDLRDAIFEGDPFINLEASFGSVTLIVPEGLAVKVAVSSAFGGVTDNRRTKVESGTPCLSVIGTVSFGGAEIKN